MINKHKIGSQNKKINIVLDVAVILLSVIFVVSLSAVIYILFQNKKNKDYYNGIIDKVLADTSISEGSDHDSADESGKSVSEKRSEDNSGIKSFNDPGPVKVDFNKLKKLSDNICGWLYIPGTPVNYPVAHYTDDSFYLHHLPDGTYSYAGTLFMETANDVSLMDFNTVIYGHNMRSGTMFGTLDDYKDPSYYEAHPVMYYMTPEKTYRIQIFAGIVTKAGSDVYSLNQKKLRYEREFVRTYIGSSYFDSGTDSSDVKKVMTLSTCDYSFSGARFALMGSMREYAE